MDIIQFIAVSFSIVHTVTSEVKTIHDDDTSNGTLAYEVKMFNKSLDETRQASVLSMIDIPLKITNKLPVTKTRESSVIVTIKPLIATITELPSTTTTELPVTTEPKFTKNIEPSVTISVITNTESPVTTITELPVINTTELTITVNTEQQFTKTTEPSVRTTKDSLVLTNTQSPVTTITELPVNTKEPPLTVNPELQFNETTESSVTATNKNSSVTTNTQSSVAITTELPATTTEELPLWVRQLIQSQQSSDSSNATTKLSETEDTEFYPCLQEAPKMPDFSAPGLRISEIKCKEYIWNVEEREILSRQSFECDEYRASKIESFLYAVAGGRDALPAEFPHMAAIGWRGTQNSWVFKCGSTLISSKFVLTAAHCTKVSSRDSSVIDPLPKIVRMGVTDIAFASYFPPNDHGITKIIVHPQYKAPKQYYDIALMELDSEIQFDPELHPACLWNNFDTSKLGTKASVTGWGVLKSVPIPNIASPILQVGDVDIINSQTCDNLLRPHCNRKQCGIQDHQICAGILAGGVDACQGDSGGPLQVMIPLPKNVWNEEKLYYVIGVTSYGVGCALENSPGVYTRVSSFIDWIEEIVWPQ